MKRKLHIFAFLCLISLGFLFLLPKSALAFDQNRLIDDPVVDDVNSMTPAQIDAFLNTQPYSCISPNSGFEARIPTGYSPSGGFTYGGFGSAGQVIAAAAQAYDLNPKVLIVTLEKEQSLITGRSSSTYCYGTEHKYAAAVGYGCPDSGGSYNWTGVSLYRRSGVEHTDTGSTCVNSAQKAGFSQQLIRASWLLKFSEQRSKGNVDWAIVRGSWDNSDDLSSCYSGPMTPGWRKACPNGSLVLYDGLRTIDGTTVTITTGGTAALYWYTPHFNGNQNFVNLFNNWFGSTFADAYKWEIVGQYAYTDNTKTVGKNLVGLLPGERVYIGFKAKNMGSSTWSNTGSFPINVGTVRPLDRSSPFCDGTWLGCNRPARLVEASVAPGEIGTFEFWYKAPNTLGTYDERFGLLAEGTAWLPDLGMYFHTVVMPPTFTWQIIGQYAYTDETKTTGRSTANRLPGDRTYVGVKVRNTGNMTWTKNSANTVLLAPIRPLDVPSAFYDSTWPSNTRAATLVESSVAPGGIGTFEFWLKAPSQLGAYPAHFGLVAEGVAWMPDIGLNFYTTVTSPFYAWQLVGQYAYTDATKTTGKSMIGLTAGERVYVGFKARNTGNATWNQTSPNPVHTGTIRPVDRLSPFFDSAWLGQNRPAALTETSVAPGEIGTFEFWMKAPSTPGAYPEFVGLVAEGVSWMNDLGLNFYSTVQ